MSGFVVEEENIIGELTIGPLSLRNLRIVNDMN